MIIDGVRIPLPIGWTDEDLTPEMIEHARQVLRLAREAQAASGAIPTPPDPSLVAKAASFAAAVVKHVAAGCPTRTEKRQAELKTICLSCIHQRGEAASCAVCGCTKMDWKRSMKLEKCPLGLWPEDEP